MYGKNAVAKPMVEGPSKCRQVANGFKGHGEKEGGGENDGGESRESWNVSSSGNHSTLSRFLPCRSKLLTKQSAAYWLESQPYLCCNWLVLNPLAVVTNGTIGKRFHALSVGHSIEPFPVLGTTVTCVRHFNRCSVQQERTLYNIVHLPTSKCQTQSTAHLSKILRIDHRH